MVYKFTNRAEKAITLAQECAKQLGHSYVGSEHLLYGLIKEGNIIDKSGIIVLKTVR